MRQAVLVEPKHIEFREVEAPKASDLKEHQVLLNIKRIGICGSEIHSYHGCHPATFYPVVQGHEYSAVVVATGTAVTICKAGDIVTARPQLACGKCKPCQRGEYNICEELRVQAFQANGAAQDFFVVDDDRVAVLPEGMSLDYGAMIEPVAVAAHATMRGGDLKGKNVVVSGAGTIGNLVAQFAKARGAKRVLITDVSDFRLEIARKCGIVDTLNVAKTPLKEGAKRLFGDEDFQAAFEVAGVESSIRSLMECIEKGSTIVVVAVFGKNPSLDMFYLGEHELKVSSVSIDAYHSSVITHKNCKISKLKKNGADLTFDYLAYALPYPLDSISRSGWGNKRSQRDAMQLVPFMEEFNQERFQVTNLEKGMYRLTIDNQFIDNLSSEKLANGVNLADYPNTPQYQQAAKIMYLNEERFEVEKRFREYLWTEYSFLKKEGLLFADDQKAIDKLKEYLPKDGFLRMSYDWYIKAMNPEIREVWSNYMKTIVETIYKINKPVTHKVRLARVE